MCVIGGGLFIGGLVAGAVLGGPGYILVFIGISCMSASCIRERAKQAEHYTPDYPSYKY